MRTRRSPKNQDRLWRELGKEKGPTVCEWKENEDGAWVTACGEIYEFTGLVGPEGNSFKFCPFCGKPLKEIAYKEEANYGIGTT